MKIFFFQTKFCCLFIIFCFFISMFVAKNTFAEENVFKRFITPEEIDKRIQRVYEIHKEIRDYLKDKTTLDINTDGVFLAEKYHEIENTAVKGLPEERRLVYVLSLIHI